MNRAVLYDEWGLRILIFFLVLIALSWITSFLPCRSWISCFIVAKYMASCLFIILPFRTQSSFLESSLIPLGSIEQNCKFPTPHCNGLIYRGTLHGWWRKGATQDNSSWQCWRILGTLLSVHASSTQQSYRWSTGHCEQEWSLGCKIGWPWCMNT